MTESHSRPFRSFHVAMISIGGIIGAGLFVGTSATITAAGPAVLLSYLGAGLIVFIVMRLLGGLAIMAEGEGSFITHIQLRLGSRPAFVTGWAYAFLWAVTAGAQAVAGGFILQQLTAVPVLAGALGFVGVAWAVNRLSLRYYAQAEAILSMLKLVFLGGFILLGVVWLCASGHPFETAGQNLLAHGGFFPKGGWAVLVAVPMIMQSFTGCEIAMVAAADSGDPVANIRRTMRRLPVQILFFYAGSVLVIMALMPWSWLRVGYSPFLEVLQGGRVPFAAHVAAVITLVAVLSCLNSAVYVVSRVMKEMAGLGLAPAKLAAETRRHVPLWSLRLTTVLELGIIAVAFSAPQTLYPVLLGASGGVILFVYVMIAYACVCNRALPTQERCMAWGLMVVIPLCVVLLLALPRARFDTELSLLVMSGLTLWVWVRPMRLLS